MTELRTELMAYLFHAYHILQLSVIYLHVFLAVLMYTFPCLLLFSVPCWPNTAGSRWTYKSASYSKKRGDIRGRVDLGQMVGIQSKDLKAIMPIKELSMYPAPSNDELSFKYNQGL